MTEETKKLMALVDELEGKIQQKCLDYDDEELLELIHELVEANLELEQECNQ